MPIFLIDLRPIVYVNLDYTEYVLSDIDDKAAVVIQSCPSSLMLPLACFTIRVVEHLLNFFWLMTILQLLVLTVRASQRGQLRCSLPVTLGCLALLALILFPALSMTDDLQSAKLDVESSVRHIGATLLLGSPDDHQMQTGPLEATLLLLLIAVARRKTLSVPPRSEMALPRVRLSSFRPEAVRPPPALI